MDDGWPSLTRSPLMRTNYQRPKLADRDNRSWTIQGRRVMEEMGL